MVTKSSLLVEVREGVSLSALGCCWLVNESLQSRNIQALWKFSNISRHSETLLYFWNRQPIDFSGLELSARFSRFSYPRLCTGQHVTLWLCSPDSQVCVYLPTAVNPESDERSPVLAAFWRRLTSWQSIAMIEGQGTYLQGRRLKVKTKSWRHDMSKSSGLCK